MHHDSQFCSVGNVIWRFSCTDALNWLKHNDFVGKLLTLRDRVCKSMLQYPTIVVVTFNKKKVRKDNEREAIYKHLLQGRSEENCEPLLCTDTQENTPRQ